MIASPTRLLLASLLPLALLAGCKQQPTTPPPKPVAAQPAAVPERTREEAVAALMALPELHAWSAQIERTSHGRSHGAVIEDDPAPRIVNGKAYFQLSFVENRKQDVHRLASFLVARQGDEILVDDVDSDKVQSLAEWRRNIRRVELKAAG